MQKISSYKMGVSAHEWSHEQEGMVPPAYSQVWWVSDLTKYCGITLWSSKGKEKLVQKSWHMKKYVHFTKAIFTQYSWQLYFKATSPWFCSNCDYSNACPEPRWFSWLCWRQTGEHSWVRHSLEYNMSMELLCSGFRAGPWCWAVLVTMTATKLLENSPHNLPSTCFELLIENLNESGPAIS